MTSSASADKLGGYLGTMDVSVPQTSHEGEQSLESEPLIRVLPNQVHQTC